MLTLTQLSELAKTENIDLFEGLTLPEGSPLDRDIIINTILMRCGLNYPNFADPKVMQSAITVWSAKSQYTFEHIAKIYTASYSPIENYDRYEDMETDRDRSRNDNTTGKNFKSEVLKSDRTSQHSGTDTTTDTADTSAYNANDFQPTDKTTSSLQHGEKVTDGGNSNKSTSNESTNNKGVKENEKTKQNNHIRGNIGVMTATEMQEAEYSLLDKHNPYDFIAGLFENELTLFIY